MSLTLPQIILLNHAAWVNAERSGLNDHNDSASSSSTVFNGKRLDEMTTEEMVAYYM